MKVITVVLAFGAAIALVPAAHAHSHPRAAHLIRVPVVAAADPSWPVDYYTVPRYRYRPQDDRVDTSPTAKPVAPSDGDFGGTGGSGW
jgi:hypothetical protein